MHIHVLVYEDFSITIISPHETIKWEEVINNLIGETVING